MSNPSMPSASQPWRPRAAQQKEQQQSTQQVPPPPASKGGRGNAGFETDTQIRDRTNARGNSHAANTFAKYGQQQQGGGGNTSKGGNHHGGGGGHHGSSSSNQPPVVVAPVSSATTAQKENQFNLEDALDAFANLKVHPMAARATEWAPVTDSGVTYEPFHKNVGSFLKMCRDAQEKK